MKKYDYLIVGAGLFGATAAYELCKKGKKCLVIDKRKHIGGNIYTEEIEGIQVHKYGAHIFHTSNRDIWEYINNFGEFYNYVNSPIAIYKGEVYNLPFNMNTFNKMWGVRNPDEAKAIIEEQVFHAGIREVHNLEEQALSMVGKDIYEKLIKGYTKKQWGKECKELPAFIIKRLPLRFTYDNNYFNDKYQGIPVGGYTAIISKMLQDVDVCIEMDYLQHREKLKQISERIIFTGMIDSFFDYQKGHLEYRSLYFDTELLNCENYQGNAVVNYTEEEIPYTRIIEHKHFLKGQQSKTIITREYPQMWKKGEEPYYPVNDTQNNAIYEEYVKLAKQEENIYFGGRLGTYHYLDMDKTIMGAIQLVEAIE